ncbi:outer membrane lipoprotein-sorting protein [Vibrio kasasachensis]|uniref:outer membrane lipoprotein-sorting protein n=1 Tax=Vibrio kasasachensis TaxID=2910248 RepID=UPI003D0E2E96
MKMMAKKWVKTLALASIAAVSLSNMVYANVERGLEIAKERKARDEGWGDSIATMEMILTDSQGASSTRLMRLKNFEMHGDGDKGLTIFDQPRDVKGTAFLNHSHISEADDQWLYLPALKRVKRISSRNKSGPFMGSEFSYEDLSSFELEKYSFSFVKDERLGDVSTFVLEQIPTDKHSGYTKQITWLDSEHYRPLKVEFYDRRGAILKTLTFSDYQQYLSKYWRAHKMVMVNHLSGKSTELKTSALEFQTGLTEKDFQKNVLKRVR